MTRLTALDFIHTRSINSIPDSQIVADAFDWEFKNPDAEGFGKRVLGIVSSYDTFMAHRQLVRALFVSQPTHYFRVDHSSELRHIKNMIEEFELGIGFHSTAPIECGELMHVVTEYSFRGWQITYTFPDQEGADRKMSEIACLGHF